MEAVAMRTDGQAMVLGGDLKLPWNLQEWCDAAALRSWVEEELASLDWENPEIVRHLQQRPGYEPRKLLGLLTYAYSTAVYESEEIRHRCQAEPESEYQALAGPRWRPQARELSRFRRENRGLLKWALVQISKRALRAHLAELMLPAGLKRRLVDSVVARLDYARQMDQHQEREDI